MAATISSTSTRITISGNYKAFTSTTGSTSTVIQYSTGDAPASGDAGRFLLWKNGANTGDWEVRYIESATSTTVTVGDGGFSSAPASGEDFAISTNLDDIDTALANSIVRSSGRSYQIIDRDFQLTNSAFVADVNASLSTKSTQTGGGFIATYPVANNCVLQFGRLVGGEANDSTETIEGCQILLEVSNNTLMFTNQGSFNSSGCVLNFYGCLIESIGNGFSPFIRAPGPMRIIGCVCDGPMGGRLYSEASELVDTRFSGNLFGGVAWSLGASFTRAIDNAFFYQNVAAIKSFQAFTGTFSNTRFADSNTYIIEASASAGLLFSFIDCTTFDVSKINNNTGNYEQLKSINYTTTDSSGTGLTGVKVAVYDTLSGVQGGGVQTSSSGTVPAINARFFRKEHNVSTPINYAPFDIRIRKYGYQYQDFQSAVSEPIKQEFRLPDNTVTVLSEASAAALTFITIDFTLKTVTVQRSRTLSEIYDYCQSQLALDANMDEPEFLTSSDGNVFTFADDWDLILDASGAIESASGKTVAFGGTGVLQMLDSRNTIDNLTVIGDIELDVLITPLTGITAGAVDFSVADTYTVDGCTFDEVTNSSGGSVTLNADLNSTITTNTGPNITIVFPTLDLTVTSSESGSLIQVFTTTTQTILASTTGTSLVYTHSDETVDIVVQKAGFIPFRQTGVVLSGNVPIQADLVTDLNYLASHGLTYTTDASWSRANNELTVPTFGPTGQQVYSLMVDSFISETTLRNTAFNLQMNGPQSLIFINAAEGATDGDITNLTQCGVEYRTAAGVETAEWTGFQSSGVVAGSQPEFQQVSGGSVTDARTTGNVNELIKTFGDATHGNFDYRNYFDWKVQTNGYRQAETDILASFGISQLSPILYIFSLTEIAIDGLVLGDPSPTGLSLTDDSASPVSWDAGDGSKDYSITITDTGSNSGETILRWLNYNLSLDATFEGKNPFDWPEMVLDNGAAYETLRGTLHKAGGDVLAGVRVIDGSGDPHPDFTRFQSDDGTYGTPPNKTIVTASNILDGARYLRFINGVAAGAQAQVSGGSGISETLTEGVDYTAGQTIAYWVAYVSGTTAKMELLLSGVLPSGGGSITFVESMQDSPTYNANAIDGSSVTGYSHDDTNDEIDITIAPNFSIKEMYAWIRYQVYSDREAMLDFFQEIDGEDVGNYRLNDTRLTIRIDNTNGVKAKETSGARLYTATGDGDPIKNPTTNGPIDLNWREPVLIAQDADIEAMKATIDANLDATVSSRSTQTSVDAIQSDLDTNLDATVSSRSTQTSVDSIPTSVPTTTEIKNAIFDEIV